MHFVPFLMSSLRVASIALAGLAFAVPSSHAQSKPLERGRYLVTTIMACGNCHTPKDAQGRPIAGKELSGGGVAIDIPPFAVVTPNITPTATPASARGAMPRSSARSRTASGRRAARSRASPWP